MQSYGYSTEVNEFLYDVYISVHVYVINISNEFNFESNFLKFNCHCLLQIINLNGLLSAHWPVGHEGRRYIASSPHILKLLLGIKILNYNSSKVIFIIINYL